MNNRGWGLSALLGFLAVLGIFLMISVLLYKESFSNINEPNKEELEKEQKEQEIEAVIQGEEYNENNSKQKITLDDYQKLESDLKESAERYVNLKKISSEYRIVITYENIKHENLLTNFNDPKTGTICNGYVIYYNNQINPFIKCNSNYQTVNYDEQLD